MKPEDKKMYFLNKFCCICMEKSNLKYLFDVDNDGVSHYNKLTSSVAEMHFKELNDQKLICGKCCVTLNTVYNFRQTCLRSKTSLITYISQLQAYGHVSGTLSVLLTDFKSETTIGEEGIKIKCENEDSNCLEENGQLNEFQTESYEDSVHFPASVKEEWKSEEDASSAHEDTTVNCVNERDVKIEDEPFIEYTEIDIEEDPLPEVKEEPVSDTETPQDGSTSQGISGEPKECEGTTVGTEHTLDVQEVVERLHKCEICKKDFTTKTHLANHMKLHSSQRYECEICKKSFTLKSYRAKHMKSHSKERYECEICQKSFTVKKYLNSHLRLHSSERPYECEVCKKKFILRNYLTRHMTIHSNERPFECEMCKKTFPMKKNLTQHMKQHSAERPYECTICKRNFAIRSNLTAHLKKHSTESQFECEICKKNFRYKHSLNVHLTSHTNDKPYECEICKKRCTGKYTLALHVGVHSREKSFKCEICNKSFNKRSRLNRHMRTHSAESLG